MIGLRVFGSILLLAATAASVPARYDWSQVDLAATMGLSGDYLEEAVPSQNACRANLATEPPASDWPAPQERAALGGCDSEALYFGIGIAADPVAARKCALIERENEVGPKAPEFGGLGYSYFSGTGILAMVYANGAGVPRNLPVAIHMACGIEDAPAASEGRIEALIDHAAGGGDGKPFGICDHATSGISAGHCADHDQRIAAQQREQRIAGLRANWNPGQQALFAKAYSSFDAYAGVAHEMDCFRGTAQAACSITGSDRELEEFLRRIELIAKGEISRSDERGEHHPASPARGGPDFAMRDPFDREWYRANYDAAVAARAMFERDLLAFFQATFPRFSRREVRQMFRDL
jgi:hypothetical protein